MNHFLLTTRSNTLAAGLIALVLLIAGGTGRASAQSTAPPASPDAAQLPAAGRPLLVEQQRLARRFAELEGQLIALAEYIAAEDPLRAAMLRRAVKLARERAIGANFQQAAKNIESDRVRELDGALAVQRRIETDLKSLLELLGSENRAQRVKSEKARIREYVKILGRVIKQQEGIQGRTQGGEDAKSLAERQARLAQQADELAQRIKANEEPPADPANSDPAKDGKQPGGKIPGDAKKQPPSGGPAKKSAGPGKPPQNSPGSPAGKAAPPKDDPDDSSHPARRRIEAAQQRMRQAQQKLEQAQREGAAAEQDEALRELNRALAELEKILRQLREEEVEQMLTLLEARFQKMLALQHEVYDGTQRIDRVPAGQRGRDDEIAAARLGRTQRLIVAEADRALALLSDDGTVVAFPVALEQIREDMVQVAEWLAQGKVGAVTQGTEEDVIAALEEMIEALKKAIKDQRQQRRPPPGGSQQGEPRDPPLVDALAELKMIRSLQMRINRRTQRYGRLKPASAPEQSEVDAAKARLAGRQQQLYRIIRDLDLGKNR